MKKAFIASVKDDYINRVNEVAERLEHQGCEITRIMGITGTITGKVDMDTDFKNLYVEGVAVIEKEKSVRKRKG